MAATKDVDDKKVDGISTDENSDGRILKSPRFQPEKGQDTQRGVRRYRERWAPSPDRIIPRREKKGKTLQVLAEEKNKEEGERSIVKSRRGGAVTDHGNSDK